MKRKSSVRAGIKVGCLRLVTVQLLAIDLTIHHDILLCGFCVYRTAASEAEEQWNQLRQGELCVDVEDRLIGIMWLSCWFRLELDLVICV
jgi:hypothetical protein